MTGSPPTTRVARLTKDLLAALDESARLERHGARADGAPAVKVKLGDHLDFSNGSTSPAREPDGRYSGLRRQRGDRLRGPTQCPRPADRARSRRILLRQSALLRFRRLGHRQRLRVPGQRARTRRDIGITRCRPAGSTSTGPDQGSRCSTREFFATFRSGPSHADERQRIAGLLGALDDKIAANDE